MNATLQPPAGTYGGHAPGKTVSTGKTPQPSVAAELLRGNADALDRIHPQLGPSLFCLACALLVFGLWLKRGQKRPRTGPDDNYASMC